MKQSAYGTEVPKLPNMGGEFTAGIQQSGRNNKMGILLRSIACTWGQKGENRGRIARILPKLGVNETR